MHSHGASAAIGERRSSGKSGSGQKLVKAALSQTFGMELVELETYIKKFCPKQDDLIASYDPSRVIC